MRRRPFFFARLSAAGAGALALLGCTPRATVTAPSTAASQAPPLASAPLAPPATPSARVVRARWVPRVTSAYGMMGGLGQKIYGPASNNFGTAATAWLAPDRVGLLANGRRFVFERDTLTAVDPEGTATYLEAITSVAPAFGGGFVFTGPDGLFFADAFDAPLRRLATTVTTANAPPPRFQVGPRMLLVSPPGELVSTKDAKPVKAPTPTISQMVTQEKSGFALVASVSSPGKSWLTSDGRTWKEIAVGFGHQTLQDGDALIVVGNKGAHRVTRDGKVTALTLSREELSERFMKEALTRESPAAEAGYPGALIEAGFTPTGRGNDEWYGLRGHQIWRTNVRTREMVAIGAPVGKDDTMCSGGLLEGVPHVFCFQLGKALDIYSLDLSSGATAPVYSFEVKKGMVSRLGTAPNVFPQAQIIMATCDGDATPAANAICIRDTHGKWQTFPRPTGGAGTVAPFPGELITIAAQPDGSVEMRNAATGAHRTFAAADVARIQAEVGQASLVKGHIPDVVDAGILRTPDGIRIFHSPNPFEPIVKAISHYSDYPFDTRAGLSSTTVDGVVAGAGLHALRLSGGSLWQTDDGWTTWVPAESPPTGVPADLAGAMCTDAGCVLGPWARLGWDR